MYMSLYVDSMLLLLLLFSEWFKVILVCHYHIPHFMYYRMQGDCDGALCVEMADMHEAVVSNITIR